MPLNRLHDIPFYQMDKYSDDSAIVHKVNGKWVKHSSQQICDEVTALSHGLAKRYAGRTNIGIFAESSVAQWNIVDFAIMRAGHVSVPLHGNASKADIIHIIKDSEMKLIFVYGDDQLKLLDELQLQNLEICSLEKVEDLMFYRDLFEKEAPKGFDPNRIATDDLATIIYTSGSTGLPKGVMLSHSNIISNIKSSISLIPVNHRHTTASFLPLSHIFERTATYAYLTVGASLHYIDDPKSLLKNIQEIRPHYMTSVPRILEKVYDYINKEIKNSGIIKKKIVKWALTSSKRARKLSLNPLKRVELVICDLIVFRKWRKLMGGRLRGMLVGAAAMPPHIAMLFCDAGILIREGYGLTETSPIVSFNRFEAGGNKFGTVGIPLPGVNVKILDPNENGEGEIVVKGPNVMIGYYKNEALTNEKIDKDGWFHTGDVGKITHKRFLTITDRKKNIFKTTSGRYVAPQVIEALLKTEELIDQAMIIGFNRPHLSALLVPNMAMLENWCKENNVHWTGPQYMVIHPKVVKLYEEIIEEINGDLKRHEYIKKFHLHHEEWSVSTGEYTPTLKLKRKDIVAKYEKQVKKMYD